MTRPGLASWQRNMIALALGVKLSPSGKMKWTANIDVHGATPEDSAVYSFHPIEADLEIEAAQAAALSVATALYGGKAQVGFVNPQEQRGLYMATVGEYYGAGVTNGRSLKIIIRKYHGVY